MAMQFPQMHLNLSLNCVNQFHVIILKRTMNLDKALCPHLSIEKVAWGTQL